MKLRWLTCLMVVMQLGNLIAQQPYARQFTDEEGLPSLTIYQIAQDEDGFLWLGTSNGFCRYDGVNFIEYKSNKATDREFVGVYIAPNNVVWTWNISGELFKVKNKKLILYQPSLLEFNPINEVLADKQGKLYLSLQNWSKKDFLVCDTDNDSCYYQKRYAEIRGFMPLYKKIGQSNTSQIVNTRTFDYMHFKNEEAYSRQLLASRGMLISSRFDFYYSKNDFIYVFNRKVRTIFKMNITNSQSLSTEDLTLPVFHNQTNKDYSILHFHEDKSNNIWIIDEKQLYVFNTKNELIYQNNTLFKNIRVNYFFEDKEGGYWVGTNAKGLFYIPSLKIKTFKNSELTTNNDQITQLIGEEQSIIAATSQGSILRLKDDKIITLKKLNTDFTILKPQKYSDNYWYNSSSQGLFVLDRNFNKKQKIPSKLGAIKDLDETEQGLLVANQSDVRYFLKNTLYQKKQESAEELLQKRVYSVHYKNDSTALVGTVDGLYILSDNETIQPFYLKNAVRPFSYWTTDITTHQGLNIIATKNNGLFFLNEDKVVEHFNTENGLLSNSIKSLFIDDYNRLWAISSKDLSIIDLKEMTIKTLNQTNGLPAANINAIYSKNNQVWISTSKGLTTFNFNDISFQTADFPIIISNIKVAGQSQNLQESYYLEHDQNTLSFEFISPSYKHQGDILYSYRMVGLDEKWQFTTDNSIQYDRLKPGRYQFKVRATTNEGNPDGIVKSVTIHIKKSIYNTVGFYVVLLVILAILSFVGFRIWLNFYQKRQEKEAYFNRQFSELKTSALQSQMNPHFIFNALNAIQHFFTTNDKESAMLYLGKFARLIRLIFEYSKTSAITLEQELKFLSLYLQLEKLRFGEKIQIELVGMDIIGKEYILVPPLLIQPAIENALKHGLLHKEKDGELLVKFEKINDKTLRVLILDNGIGREKAKEYNAWKPKEYKSSGIQTIQERVRLANHEGGKKDIQFNIIDLKDDYNQPTGTKVEFVFKIKKIINEFEEEE